jgi:hypothetical protein
VRSASALCVPHSLPRSRGKEKSCRAAAWTPIARGHYQKLAGSEWISISWWGAEISLGGGFPALVSWPSAVVVGRRGRFRLPTSEQGEGGGGGAPTPRGAARGRRRRRHARACVQRARNGKGRVRAAHGGSQELNIRVRLVR